jgi:hypothetical protein
LEGEQLVGLLQISLQFEIVIDIASSKRCIFFYYKEHHNHQLQVQPPPITGNAQQISKNARKTPSTMHP